MVWQEEMENGLLIENLSVRFEQPVIRDLNLKVPRASIVALVGPSGCGKTTLLRTIAGFHTPEAGKILIDGIDVTNQPAQRRKTGLVFQTPTLFPGLDVRENIAFGLDDANMSDSRRNDLVDISMAIMNVTGLAGRMPHQLSGGQGQRVSLARTIVRRPRALLLDEPVVHVEAALRHAIHADISSQVRRMGMSAVYVTHDINDACIVGDEIAIMRNGHIVQQGSPRWVYNHPDSRFVAQLMGVNNTFTGVVRESRDGMADVALGRLRVTLPSHSRVRPGPVTVFVPPESIGLRAGQDMHSGLNGQIIVAGFARSHMVYDVETDIGTLVVHEPTSARPRDVGSPVVVTLNSGWVMPPDEAD